MLEAQINKKALEKEWKAAKDFKVYNLIWPQKGAKSTKIKFQGL